ncbi:DUF2334 domain-containing protein [Ornithinibacillus salinisoli]|uniref:DUF2334 domain-containing protein n=1 Tax=Ornithinibacillus salinisoli TaxID=1848459 RepID=A0ABW4VVS6_9BACI
MVYKKLLFLTIIFIFPFFEFVPDTIHASSTMHDLDERKVLIIYYGADDQTFANVHFLDSTLSGMFQSVEVLEWERVNNEELQEQDIVVFYSAKKTDETSQDHALNEFDGRLLAIGKGAKDLHQFQNWSFLGMKTIHRVSTNNLTYPAEILHVDAPENATVIVYGQQFDEKYPVIIQDGQTSYIALNNLFSQEKYAITHAMYDLFQLEKPKTHPAYIRLEDISPVSDPELVLEAGSYLLDKGIPVYLAMIPVYVNSNTGEKITLEKKPKLRKALDELVRRGAYVISHGYTHSYRYAETGEGFEFWDAELNQPITTLNPEEIPEKIKMEDQFASKGEYNQYVNNLQKIETEYVQTKLQDSIHSLTKLEYTPVAFEAPHYTMSSNGYNVVSTYFSALFGQMQVSDKNWEVMINPLFISKPSILNGMTLYPETIGFVDDNLDDPIAEMEQSISNVVQVPGAVIGGFYHPYLGVDYLKEMVALLEKVPNLEWIELRNEKHFVKTDLVHIVLPGNGEVQVDQTLSWKTDVKDRLKEKPFEIALWLVVFATLSTIVIFIIHILTLRIRYRKRLFKERN